MTALGDHAVNELDRIDAPSVIGDPLTMIVGTFADVPDPETNWVVMRDYLDKLLKFEPLSPITADPAEWVSRFEQAGNVPIWQSIRWPNAWTRSPTFATYFLMTEAGDEAGEIYATDPYTP
jgi:hypothetical protein